MNKTTCALILAVSAAAQELPALLQVDVENWVNYGNPVIPSSQLAQNPGIPPPGPASVN